MKNIHDAFISETSTGNGFHKTLDTNAAINHLFQAQGELEQKLANQAAKISMLEANIRSLEEFKSNKLFKRKPVTDEPLNMAEVS